MKATIMQNVVSFKVNTPKLGGENDKKEDPPLRRAKDDKSNGSNEFDISETDKNQTFAIDQDLLAKTLISSFKQKSITLRSRAITNTQSRKAFTSRNE